MIRPRLGLRRGLVGLFQPSRWGLAALLVLSAVVPELVGARASAVAGMGTALSFGVYWLTLYSPDDSRQGGRRLLCVVGALFVSFPVLSVRWWLVGAKVIVILLVTRYSPSFASADLHEAQATRPT